MKWYEPLKAEKADRRGEHISLGEAFEAPLLAWRWRGLWVDEMESTVLQPQGSEFFQQPEMSLETKSSSKPLDKSSGCLNQDFSHRSLWAEERVGPLCAGTSDPLWDNKWILFSSYLFILDGGDVWGFFFFFLRFIYFVFWLRWVFIAGLGLSLVSEIRVYALSQWAGFSLRWFPCCRAWALRVHELSRWDLPGPGIQLVSLAWRGRFSTAGTPRSPTYLFLIEGEL